MAGNHGFDPAGVGVVFFFSRSASKARFSGDSVSRAELGTGRLDFGASRRREFGGA
jgi:hypothetical protein